MKEYRDIYDWAAPETGCVITIGRFDGVHLGHRALIERTVRLAGMHSLTPVCLSFQENTYPGAEHRGQLTTDEEKAELLNEIGIEVLLHPAFEFPLIDMAPSMFLHTLLISRWFSKMIVVGYDFHFGKDRAGDADFIAQECAGLGIDVEILSPFMVDDEIVKATLIRESISDGSIAHANKLLGRPYSVRGHAVQGKGLGRKIGFPTINFEWPELKVKPRPGIYALRIESDAFRESPEEAIPKKWNAVANFGFRPTIDPDNREPMLEVHILDDIPAQFLDAAKLPPDAVFKIEFHKFIREEKKFDSVEELAAQIGEDCRIAGEILEIP